LLIHFPFVLFQKLLETLNELLQIANPESNGPVARVRQASDSAYLLSTTRTLDDISGTNVFTFPVDMQKQPPGYENIPALAEESLPASKKRKKEKKAKASTQVILSVDVQRVSTLDSLHCQGVGNNGKIAGEQDAHLDGLIDAIFAVINLTPGKGYIGAVLNSAGFIHPLKKLSREEFAQFKREFSEFPCPGDEEGRKLIEVMPGSDVGLKLRAAWRIYAVRKLSQQGVDVKRPWTRAYIEMAEGVMAICSMSLLHFGTRFPLFFDNRPVPDNLWHLRLHMYIGSKIRPRLEGEGILQDQVQDATVDIFEDWEGSDWISAAQHCYGLVGIEY
jgi:hypothetical protein